MTGKAMMNWATIMAQGVKSQPRMPKGALLGEQQEDDEADDDGREGHAGIGEADEDPAAGEAAEGEPYPVGNGSGSGEEEGQTGDLEGEEGDASDLGVKAADELEGLPDSGCDFFHQVTPLEWGAGYGDSSRWAGLKRERPNSSRRKSAIRCWVSGEMRNWMKASASSDWTWMYLSGLTMMTW